jgi:hypothetical protein
MEAARAQEPRPRIRVFLFVLRMNPDDTLIKKKINFSIYKEIQNGVVVKSYMTNGLIYRDIFEHFPIY